MHKWEVKNIINRMRTKYNEKEINLVLARVDMTPDFRLEKLIAEFGDDKNAVEKYFQENINQMCVNNDDKKETVYLNKYVKSCILRDSLVMGLNSSDFEPGLRMEKATLHALDAMRQLVDRVSDNDMEVSNLQNIVLYYDGELDMPEEFCESITPIDKSTFSDQKKLEEDSTLRKAAQMFGDDLPVGAVKIAMETLKSKEFIEMMNRKLKIYEEKGLEVEPADEARGDEALTAPSARAEKKAPKKDDEEMSL